MDAGAPLLSEGIPITVGTRAAPISDDWNEDDRKDLLVGNFDGNILIFINEGTDDGPLFNAPTTLQMAGTDFDIGTRASPRVVDWDSDGLKDLLVGEVEGYIYFLKNVGSNANPLFDVAQKLVLASGEPLRYMPGEAPRSRLYVSDWNNDGYNDLLVGGSDGRVMLFMQN